MQRRFGTKLANVVVVVAEVLSVNKFLVRCVVDLPVVIPQNEIRASRVN